MSLSAGLTGGRNVMGFKRLKSAAVANALSGQQAAATERVASLHGMLQAASAAT
jgi:hypothetical protein